MADVILTDARKAALMQQINRGIVTAKNTRIYCTEYTISDVHNAQATTVVCHDVDYGMTTITSGAQIIASLQWQGEPANKPHRDMFDIVHACYDRYNAIQSVVAKKKEYEEMLKKLGLDAAHIK